VCDDLPLKITNEHLHDRLMASQRLVVLCMFVFSILFMSQSFGSVANVLLMSTEVRIVRFGVFYFYC